MAKWKVAWKDILIMQHVANGFTFFEISKELGLSERTIEGRILRLKKQLQCKTLTHLTVTLLRENIIK